MGYAIQKRQQIPRTRFQLELPISLELIGSQNLFQLTTINISAGGALIAFDEEHMPFHEDSLLEVRVVLGSSDDAPEVCFIGKYIHHQKGIGFGIKVSQIEPDHEKIWFEFLKGFGESHPDKAY